VICSSCFRNSQNLQPIGSTLHRTCPFCGKQVLQQQIIPRGKISKNSQKNKNIAEIKLNHCENISENQGEKKLKSRVPLALANTHLNKNTTSHSNWNSNSGWNPLHPPDDFPIHNVVPTFGLSEQNSTTFLQKK